MGNLLTISHKPLTLDDLVMGMGTGVHLALSPEAEKAVVRCREFLDEKLEIPGQALYGINTGFGSLYNKHIAGDQLGLLQENLVKSHACGTGPETMPEIVRLMLFLKAQSLAYGHSGIALPTLQRIIDLYNANALPCVYDMGSLGASGDLVPLAHLSLPLLGLGEVRYAGETLSGNAFNQRMGWSPIALQAKEGLALLNGTQFMGAYGIWCVWHALRLLDVANRVAALSLDVFDGKEEPFHPLLHAIRPHPGQQQVAADILRLLEGSEMSIQEKKHVQDPYSFRCIPQVHGASADAIAYAKQVFLTEANAVTDNPIVFPEEGRVMSGGNFHGQPLALAFDFLGMALAELGSISERRLFQLVSGARDLPNYLIASPGIHSGYMVHQYTAASLASQNKQLCTPASVDSIVSSNGQEDHVSMGANAATKCARIVQNIYSILAIEWLAAVQALQFRRPLKTSPSLEKLVHTFRQHVPFMEEDRVGYEDIRKAEGFLKTPGFLS